MICRIAPLVATLSLIGTLTSQAAYGQLYQPGGALTVSVPAVPVTVAPDPDNAPAQPAPGTGVVERQHPEYDPLGLHLGTFFLYPRLELGEAYNDNVFAVATGAVGDFVTLVAPRFDLRSNWSSHQLNLAAGAEIGTYAARTSENYADYFVGLDGRFDVSEGFVWRGSAKYEHLHEERGTVDSPGTEARPIERDAYTFTTSAERQLLRINYEAGLGFRREVYSNVAAIGGGVLDEALRNLDLISPSLRLGYTVAPGREIFLRAAGDIRVYDDSTGGNPALPARDSTGYRLDLGTRIDVTGVTYVELFGGYLAQHYRDQRFGSISGVDAGARVVWNVTPLTTVALTASREVQDTDTTTLSAEGLSVNSPGYLHSALTLTIDHELLRNLLLHAEGGYQNDDFTGIDRTDNTFDLTLGARYLLNRNLYLGGSYTFTRRTSTGGSATGAFSRDLVLLRLGSQF